MKLSLDYDDTYTLNPPVWNATVRLWKSLGVDVSFVTSRKTENAADVLDVGRRLGIPVVVCDGVAKEKLFKADVWIDNNPKDIIWDQHWRKQA